MKQQLFDLDCVCEANCSSGLLKARSAPLLKESRSNGCKLEELKETEKGEKGKECDEVGRRFRIHNHHLCFNTMPEPGPQSLQRRSLLKQQ